MICTDRSFSRVFDELGSNDERNNEDNDWFKL